MELALSQSAEPHRQLASSFAEVPSVILQDEVGLEQVLDAAVHTKPVPFPSPLLEHAALPQMQGALSSALLGADPSVILQAEAVTPEARNEPSLLHVLSAAMQNIPVVPDPVHAALPQMQGALSSALLGADPSVILQAGAVRVQMHVEEVEQDVVEEVSVLNLR